MSNYEKLGEFYLGRTEEQLFMLDSRSLLTHGVILGMTGSGKTGLGIGLLEEAAIDGVPVIAVDPKGDLGNLVLGFPEMRPEDIEPWVSADEARLKGLTAPQLAEQSAANWRQGLGEWEQSPERCNLMYKGAEVAIYTPGSTAGWPISILSSWQAPSEEVLEDGELFAGLLQGAVAGLLGLLNIKFDPLSSREYLLLSAIFTHLWGQGQDVDMATLVGCIQNPPFAKLGLFDLESLYPAKDRFALAMAINSLVISPSFQNWLKGQPLDIQSILYTPQGKPRIAIMSIAHLSDSERMFFVSMLANALLSWMRRQAGTGSLRALFYMDEVAGYLPPNANPPSKAPIMTLFKQARAFGLGLVMASQNPVDFDYKALSNAGVWMVGHLQTPQDRAKVRSSLEAALGERAGSVDLDALLGSLAKRQFLAMVPGQTPQVFQSRWTLSFLRGPMTREDIKRAQALIVSRQEGETQGVASVPAAKSWASQLRSEPAGSTACLPPDVPQCWVEADGSSNSYRPVLLGVATVHYNSAKLGINASRTVVRALQVDEAALSQDWANGFNLEIDAESLQRQGDPDLPCQEVPTLLCQAKSYRGWSKDFQTWVYRNEPLQLLSCPALKAVALADEDERAFRMRLLQTVREERDRRKDQITAKYAPKVQRLKDKVARAENAREIQEQQAAASRNTSLLKVGTSLLGGLFGMRKPTLTSMYSSASRTKTSSLRAQQAGERAQAAEEELKALEQQFAMELDELSTLDSLADQLEKVEIPPKKADVSVVFCGLGWIPE